MDKQPIHFISNYHDPAIVKTCDRKQKDGSVITVPCPDLVKDYHLFMGGCDVNDQVTRLTRTRRHYRWPRRLFIKMVMWACFNSYHLMNFYNPHKQRGKRYRNFGSFMESICLSLVDTHRHAAKKLQNRVQGPERLMDVGLHVPELSPQSTGNQLCVVCSKEFNKHVKDFPDVPYKEIPVKAVKTKFWCSYCKQYLCIKLNSTCWEDWHYKQEYWR